MGSKGQICKFWSPFHQFGTGVARNFICGVHKLYILYISSLLDDKIPQRDDGGDGSRCQICKFWNPFCTFGTCVFRNFKFRKLVDFGMSHLIDDKIFPLTGCGGLSATDN